jgi:PAS domain-containing protein
VLARQAADLIERTLAEDALRESEERFRLIANTAPVMIWMSGAEKQITYLNQTWLDFTGRPLDAMLGTGTGRRPPPGRSGAMPGGCTRRPSISVSRFRWSIGSGATTANIAGW